MIGPNVVVGKGCKIGKGCRLRDCTLIGNTNVGDGVYLQGTIVSYRCNIGNWARIEGLSVLAEDVTVKE